MEFCCEFLKIGNGYLPVDISPPAQGVDHRQVQKELGDVIVRLHTPVVLTPTTVQVTWTVSFQRLYNGSSFYSFKKTNETEKKKINKPKSSKKHPHLLKSRCNQ